jgi:hypothetical protein
MYQNISTIGDKKQQKKIIYADVYRHKKEKISEALVLESLMTV